jgi:hypothetical protein
MNPQEGRDKALDALLAVAHGGKPDKQVDFATLLAALTPEERAVLDLHNPPAPASEPHKSDAD